MTVEELPEIVKTTTIGPKTTADLFEKLRSLIYADGKCSCCSHSDEEKIAMGEILLAWWTEYKIDDMDKESTE